MKHHKSYIVAITFIWIGFLAAISFMEAWLKFQAPGITIKLGLGIGQLVFTALNYVEIFCVLSLVIFSYLSKETLSQLTSKLLLSLFVIVGLQTFWLLPKLDDRAVSIINDIAIPESNLHFIYIITEVVKMVLLICYGTKSIQKLIGVKTD